MSDGLRLPEGSKFAGLDISEAPVGGFEVTMYASLPRKRKAYRVNIAKPTLKEAFLEAGRFLDEGLGLDIGLSVKGPV